MKHPSFNIHPLKFQTSNSKPRINSNHQASMSRSDFPSRFEHWSLNLHRMLEVEVWSLKFPWSLRFGVWIFLVASLHAAPLDLGHAVVLTPADLSGPEKKAVTMLIEEVEKRTQIRWPVTNVGPGAKQQV